MKDQPNPFQVSLDTIEKQLQHISHTLKAIEDASPADATDAYQVIKSAIEIIDRQQARTKSIVLSALVDYEPGVVYAFADNQFAYQMIGLKILGLTSTLSSDITPAERATTIAALIHHFNKYSISINENLSREEATLLPLIKRYFDIKELTIMQMQARNLQSSRLITSTMLEAAL